MIIYVYICLYMFVYVHICLCMFICLYTFIYVYVCLYMFMVLSYHMNGIFFQSCPEQHLQRVMISIPLSAMNPRIPGIVSLGDKHGSWIRSPGKAAYCHQRDRECGIPACSSENMAGRLGRLPHAEMEDYSHRDSVNLGVNHVLLHCLHW